MKEKKLFISAIIPQDVYVKRDADRKLKEVIQRMAKPAYISVSRQMGKTNLLIHAKKELEDLENRYVFVDITNNFTNAQDCFRYIIDQILDSNEDLNEFQKSADIIRRQRHLNISSPTKEYQDELRLILKSYPGKLVIFLDEVDDLKKHSFSDDIFAQIRKNFFLRVTYPVFERLTYVLSGVIDPEKLIKNKDNSPFNIAIPIYLGDFNFEEHEELINKAELIISRATKEYIFKWLSGNPRMTYDVLSAIEDEFIEGREIDNILVDEVIKKLYLNDFKQPPVDHIRDLIKNSTETRKALLQLKAGNYKSLSDEQINKLYLYGIITSKINKDNLTIKNKVIALALSDDWLEKIQLEKKGFYDFGKELIEGNKYKEGIKYLKDYIENEPRGNYVNTAKYYIGQAYFHLKEPEISNQYLTSLPIAKETSSYFYFLQLLFIGTNYFSIEKFNQSIKYYDEIVSDCKHQETILTAYINKGEILLSDNDYDFNNLKIIYNNALEIIKPEDNENTPNLNRSLTLINYRLGFIHDKQEDKKEEALKYFEIALKYASNIEKPMILLFIDSLSSDITQKRIIYSTVVNTIIENNLRFNDNTGNIIPFSSNHVFLCLLNLKIYDLDNEYKILFDYAFDNLYIDLEEKHQLIYKLSTYALDNNKLNIGEELLETILNFDDFSNLELILSVHQLLGLIKQNKKEIDKAQNHFNSYIELFDKHNNFNKELNRLDFAVFLSTATYYRNKNHIEKAHKACKIIEKQLNETIPDTIKVDSVLIFFYLMDFNNFSGKIIEAEDYGKKALSLINEIKPIINNLSTVDKKALIDVEDQIKNYFTDLVKIKEIQPIKINRKIGRNEYVTVKYKNGNIVVLKYKKVQKDIENGNCILVEK
jgi:hypothetical protein